jgi:hypothetical protein
MSTVILQNGEVVMGAGLLAILVLVIAGLLADSRPDPKMAFLVELMRSLPR